MFIMKVFDLFKEFFFMFSFIFFDFRSSAFNSVYTHHMKIEKKGTCCIYFRYNSTMKVVWLNGVQHKSK